MLPFLTDYRCPGGEFGYRQNLIYQTQKPRLMADDCHRIVGDVAVGLRLAEYVLRRRMYDGQRRAEFVRKVGVETLFGVEQLFLKLVSLLAQRVDIEHHRDEQQQHRHKQQSDEEYHPALLLLAVVLHLQFLVLIFCAVLAQRPLQVALIE